MVVNDHDIVFDNTINTNIDLQWASSTINEWLVVDSNSYHCS